MPCRTPLLVAIACLSVAMPAHTLAAQTAPMTAPVVVDLMKDVDAVAGKIIGLAKAIPEDKYGWRPGEGVRSVGEVLKHVAADNYLLPVAFGVAADPATGITADFKTVQAYEARTMNRDQIIADLEKSFAHLKGAMSKATPEQMPTTLRFFGTDFTHQSMWILTTTHLHEHLGQLIAYARVNGVKPPWSR